MAAKKTRTIEEQIRAAEENIKALKIRKLKEDYARLVHEIEDIKDVVEKYANCDFKLALKKMRDAAQQ